MRLKDRSKTPPKGFKFIDPLTGFVVYARNHANWMSQASEHRVANGLEIASIEEMEDQICQGFDLSVRRDFCQEYDASAPVNRKGPGSILKDMLHGFGINACWGCLDLAAKMDQWGPDGCEENMTYIVDAMQANAEHRKWVKFLPFRELGSAALVKLAISRSRLNTQET